MDRQTREDFPEFTYEEGCDAVYGACDTKCDRGKSDE